MELIYCPICGFKLENQEFLDEGIVPFCKKCNKPYFNIAYPCVIIVVENEFNEITLIKQTYGPDFWVLVAGFIKYGENAETTVKREINEEIGLVATDIKYINSYYHDKGNLMLGFSAKVIKKDFKICKKEVKEAIWCNHGEVLDKLKYASIAYKVVKEYINK